MSSERVKTTLGGVLELKRGYDLPQSQRRDGIYPIVSSAGVSGSHDEFKVGAPGVVTGRYGTIGELFYVERDFWPLNTALYVRDFKGNLPRFIYYFLHSVMFAQFSDKSSVPGVNRNHLHAIEIDFEQDIDTQRAIAKILGDLDDKIDLLRQINRTLEEIAQSVFREWFVDFEPVRAKASGANSFRGMPQDLFDGLPTKLEGSAVGDIPKGWSLASVRDVIELRRDSVQPFEHPDQIYEHFSLPAFDREQEPDLERGLTIKSGKFVVPAGCLLFSKLNPRIPRIWLPSHAVPEHPQVASTEFLVCVPRARWSRAFAYFLVKQAKFVEQLSKQATGTSNSHQRIKPAQFEEVVIVVPPEEFRLGFDELTLPIIQSLVGNRLACAKLSALRDTLLPKLISGELEAPSLEALGLKVVSDG